MLFAMQRPIDLPSFADPEPLLHIAKADMTAMGIIKRLNHVIFNEARIINTFTREDLLMLLAYVGEEPVLRRSYEGGVGYWETERRGLVIGK